MQADAGLWSALAKSRRITITVSVMRLTGRPLAPLCYRKAVVFAAAKYIGQRELSAWGITFCQLPYELSSRVE